MEPIVCVRCGASSDDHPIRVEACSGDIHCTNCEETYTAADVRAVLAAWGPVLDWIERHPAATRPAGPPAPPYWCNTSPDRPGRSLADAADPEVLR